MFVEQELTVIDYKEGLGMHTLEHMKVQRCTDQLIIWPELYSVSALYDAVVLFLSLIKMVVHAPIFIPRMERDNYISLRDKWCI